MGIIYERTRRRHGKFLGMLMAGEVAIDSDTPFDVLLFVKAVLLSEEEVAVLECQGEADLLPVEETALNLTRLVNPDRLLGLIVREGLARNVAAFSDTVSQLTGHMKAVTESKSLQVAMQVALTVANLAAYRYGRAGRPIQGLPIEMMLKLREVRGTSGTLYDFLARQLPPPSSTRLSNVATIGRDCRRSGKRFSTTCKCCAGRKMHRCL
jgi:hypothetical protein